MCQATPNNADRLPHATGTFGLLICVQPMLTKWACNKAATVVANHNPGATGLLSNCSVVLLLIVEAIAQARA